jgi:AraC family transcriptional regulator of adaptative response/methylated-DNA-[protein]-cysteine methyltransferase
MEAPWVRACSHVTHIAFEQQPPRLVRWGFHASPIEPLMIGLTEDGVLCRIEFARGRKAYVILDDWAAEWPQTEFVEDKKATRAILQKILGKSGRGKSALKLRMTGTEFQLAVWKELLKVPAGKTVSYAELARRIRKPKAVRAVGNAMGANPVPILVPCHRVIATGGGLGGFGGGLTLKRLLLEAESKQAA